MIPLEKEIMIRHLLKGKMSKRGIAAKLKVSKGTVNLISKLPKLRSREKPPNLQQFKKLEIPRRCPICGGKVNIWPCLLCHPKIGV